MQYTIEELRILSAHYNQSLAYSDFNDDLPIDKSDASLICNKEFFDWLELQSSDTVNGILIRYWQGLANGISQQGKLF